mgnify:CR=1 FL=1
MNAVRRLVAVLGALALASVLPGAVRADAVGMLDPELSRVCGGSAHAPNCTTDQVGLACCAVAFFLIAGLGVLTVLRSGRKEKQ